MPYLGLLRLFCYPINWIIAPAMNVLSRKVVECANILMPARNTTKTASYTETAERFEGEISRREIADNSRGHDQCLLEFNKRDQQISELQIQVEREHTSNARVRKELAASKKREEDSEITLRNCQTALRETQNKQSHQNVEVDRLKRALEKERKEGRAKLEAGRSQIAEAERTIDALRKERQEARASQEVQFRQIMESERVISVLMKELEAKSTLLEARTSELKVAQAFLTKADSLSGAEIVRVVEDLNTDIYQTAATLEDLFTIDGRQDVLPDHVGHLSGLLGPDLVRAIVTSEDTIYLQSAIQSILCLYASWISNSWYLRLNAEEYTMNAAQNEVYRAIYAREPQAVAGRWRSLTRCHIGNSLHHGIDLGSELYAKLEEDLFRILSVARCRANPQGIYGAIRQNCGERLRSVVDLSIRLNRIMGQDTISADMSCLYSRPGKRFDPSCMEDTDEDICSAADDRSMRRHILCTTGLGLRKVEKTNGSSRDDARSETILLKAKVAIHDLAGGESAQTGGPGAIQV